MGARPARPKPFGSKDLGQAAPANIAPTNPSKHKQTQKTKISK
tara:strand:+ start:1937 stop:2065 length:129 start_codon:yes stop_codon:yes gene_type:complete